MALPKDFGFGEDETMLRDTARRFFTDHLPTEQLHKLVAENPDPEVTSSCHWQKDLWQQMVDLGWTMIAVPEAAGGLGMPVVAAAALAEEAGRVCLPSPLLQTLSATYVLAACDAARTQAAMDDIISGKTLGIAATNKDGSWQHDDTDVTASSDGDTVLNGTAWYVQDARKLDSFLVKAKSAEGIGLYLVPMDAEGVTIIPDSIIDLSRDQAHIEFENVKISPTAIMAPAGEGDKTMAKAEAALLCLLSADIVGAGEWQLQATVEYANTRVQFDRPIGFFQAVKHPLVDMMIMIDEAKTLLYTAACAYDNEPDNALNLARMAKSVASDAAEFCSNKSIQLHGGIGFTWESFMHLYFKRQKHSQQLLGDGFYHRAKLADAMIGPISSQ